MAKANQAPRTASGPTQVKPTKQQVLDAICQRYEAIRVAENEIRVLRASFPNALPEPEVAATNGIVKAIAPVPAK